jgi:hypothetical protein
MLQKSPSKLHQHHTCTSLLQPTLYKKAIPNIGEKCHCYSDTQAKQGSPRIRFLQTHISHKTFEQMFNTTLTWFLDKQSKLDDAQSGFHPGHSTIENLVQLETQICTGMANNKYT